MSRRKLLLGLDTETCNGFMEEGKLNLSDSLVYDIGWVITDEQGNIYQTRSFVIYEIFVKMKDVMASAYFSDKIPEYWKDIQNGKRKLVTFQTMREFFLTDLKEFHVKTVFAHNAYFDYNALNKTYRYITKSRFRYFFPYGTEFWDTLKMSRDTICKRRDYRSYCLKNGYMTKHKKPQVRATAEILYRYLTKDENFQESHTGLDDIMIETYILTECLKSHKKMRRLLFRPKVVTN